MGCSVRTLYLCEHNNSRRVSVFFSFTTLVSRDRFLISYALRISFQFSQVNVLFGSVTLRSPLAGWSPAECILKTLLCGSVTVVLSVSFVIMF